MSAAPVSSRSDARAPQGAAGPLRFVALAAGPLAFLALLLAPMPAGLTFEAKAVAALALWMALWWASEAAPIAATALLPLVVLPLLHAADEKDLATAYADRTVLFLLGGFIVALGVERWGLHARVALSILSRMGARPRAIVGGVMAAAALLSMWISNTATALMLAPIALSLAQAAGGGQRFAQALLLGLAWAASIGGLATPVGTPTNLIAMRWLEENTGAAVTFGDWIAVGLPATLAILPAAFLCATWGLGRLPPAPEAQALARSELARLGRLSTPEARVCLVFGLAAAAWVFGAPLRAAGLGLSDTGVAIAGALAMLLVPAGGEQRRALLTWEEAARLPWGVVLLFGGGFALAAAAESSGLTHWLGERLQGLAGAPALLVALGVTAFVILMTEFLSNVAAITLLLPILGPLAAAAGSAPASLMAPAAIAASCGFCMPAGTGPNAVAYGAGVMPARAMVLRGLFVNLVSLLVLSLIGVWLAPRVLG